MSFKRSPSKVWWASESVEYREVSASPGSQDSGFSDTETCPNSQKNNHEETPKRLAQQKISKDIFKELTSDNVTPNLTANYKEKTTPNKIKLNGERLSKSENKSPSLKRAVEKVPNTAEPVKKNRFTKNSPKVSRSLFGSTKHRELSVDVATVLKDELPNQYSKEATQNISISSDKANEEAIDNNLLWYSNSSVKTNEISSTKSLTVDNKRYAENARDHHSAPAILEHFTEDDEGITNFNNSSLSSDCESELECLFSGNLESPKHTSTPKVGSLSAMRQRKQKMPLNLYLKYQHERVPPIHTDGIIVDNNAVQKWLDEARLSYEQECMTTLQCKSIAGELNQRVTHMAACATTIIRGMLSHSRCIEIEYQSLNSEKKYIDPLIQSLAGNILDFLKTHSREVSSKILKLHDDIRSSKSDESLKLLSQLFNAWEVIQNQLLVMEVRKLVEKLEDPTSEIDLRATVTGITSISLRNPELIELFIKADIIPILLILCEKCEGSTMKSLILRALSTMCCNSLAVRQFEKFAGLQIVNDIIEEDSRPEPERSEAVALLAQITAPWLEDNHSVKGLQDYSRKMVRSLTKLAASTKCCQNLLLCSAALANLSSMDNKCIKHMVHAKTAKVLLEAIKSRGPLVSVYLLEQVATLVANMSAVEAARKQLTEISAPSALLYFLKATYMGDDVEKRLQQKSIIALSRLCGDKDAAAQVVELGGVEKLVKLCREKGERFDSDAVLVAALATLRKIADTCGTHVLSTQDAQELVEPKLLDSFLAYSTQNESYV